MQHVCTYIDMCCDCGTKYFVSPALLPCTCVRLQYRHQILYLVERYRTVVIIGETGSGKTTQVHRQAGLEPVCKEGGGGEGLEMRGVGRG